MILALWLLPKKLNYLIKSALHTFTVPQCPYCNRKNLSVIKIKYLVTRLVECNSCRLLFRCPQDENGFNFKFYQTDYQQADGITTDLPADDGLQQMLANKS